MLNYLFVCVCVCVSVYVCVCVYMYHVCASAMKGRRGFRIPRAGVTDNCETTPPHIQGLETKLGSCGRAGNTFNSGAVSPAPLYDLFS